METIYWSGGIFIGRYYIHNIVYNATDILERLRNYVAVFVEPKTITAL